MSTLTIEDFNETTKDLEFLDYYQKFYDTIENLQKNKSSMLLEYLAEFCEKLPFNYIYWDAQAQLTATIIGDKKGKEEGLKIYEKAVTKNPYSVKLWECAISWIEKEIQDDQPILLKFLDNAIANVGTDFNSHTIWKKYLSVYSSDTDKYLQILSQILSYPINEIETFYNNFYNQIETITEEQLIRFYQTFKKTNADNINFKDAKAVILSELQIQEKKIK